ncbi:uncharacterized protein EV422DRAFT_537513 [Fimicolochytrium jonesii]|uniref:uncharacterized protein n=1 Tax=Fimicolochytrium jonesii TaxID=1396493 RepID=UPI0022FE75CC|nr:uncharacterized protein EV422DRAFT_537513 [Fimicolochytrium jonesii]KAI8818568.1 hypothetical protein EV422DRAFT_537513 [Fimicolochytrium jonesii]
MMRAVAIQNNSDPHREEEVMNPLISQFAEVDIQIDYSPTPLSDKYSAAVNFELSHHMADHDVFMIDCVWPSDLAEHFVDLSQYIPKTEYEQHNPGILTADWVDGKLVALPYWADYGVFYYRQDLLTKYGFTGPPSTWDEMEEMAMKIVPGEKATNPSFAGYIGQFNAYEGLTCNLVELLHSFGGGDIVNAEKLVDLDNPNARAILSRVKAWIFDKKITPFDDIYYTETESNARWLAGNALFLRSWPNVLSETRSTPNFPAFGVTRLPGENPSLSGAALGGWHLAVSKYSRNISAAVEAVRFLSGKLVQKQRAMNYSLLPSYPSLLDDPTLCTYIDCPLLASLEVVARPSAQSAPNYLAVSRAVFQHINQYLGGVSSLDKALSDVKYDAEVAMGTWVEPVPDLGAPQYVAFSDPLGAAMLALSALVLLVALGMLGAVFYNRHDKVIKAASPLFCSLMILGNLLGLCTIFVYTGPPTRVTCILQPWMLCLSYAIVMVPMIVKTWRVYRIFNNRLARMKGSIKDSSLLLHVGIVVGVELLLLLIWTAVDAPKPSLVNLTASRFWTCKSTSASVHVAMTGVMISFNALLAVAGVAVAYLTRHVRGAFNESRYIAICIYNIFLLSTLGIPVMYISGVDVKTQYAFRSIVIIFVNAAMLGIFFGPKLKSIQRRAGSDGSQGTSLGSDRVESMGSTSERNPTNVPGDNFDVQDTKEDVMSGGVYVRSQKYKWALRSAPWKRATLNVFQKLQMLSITTSENHALEGKGTIYPVKGVQIVASTADLETGEYLLTVTGLGNLFFEFQFENHGAFAKWVDMLNKVIVGGKGITGTTAKPSTAAPILPKGTRRFSEAPSP